LFSFGGKKKKSKLFRAQITFVVEKHAKLCGRADFSICFMLKTGYLGRDLLEQFPRLQEKRRNSIIEFGPRYSFLREFPSTSLRVPRAKVARPWPFE
jgi:hypothetical protein